MVQEACTYVDKIDDEAHKMKLIDTIRTVTAGKVLSCFFSMLTYQFDLWKRTLKSVKIYEIVWNIKVLFLRRILGICDEIRHFNVQINIYGTYDKTVT